MSVATSESWVCPRCWGALTSMSAGWRCEAESLVYPVCDGIAVLLVDQAQPLNT